MLVIDESLESFRYDRSTTLETDTFGGDCMFGLLLPKVPAAITKELATKFLLPCTQICPS